MSRLSLFLSNLMSENLCTSEPPCDTDGTECTPSQAACKASMGTIYTHAPLARANGHTKATRGLGRLMAGLPWCHTRLPAAA
ncbi:hypothetical protein L207DRAFT_513735 [Hyaloscypha variabilis F]|uniref:Extracellular membrane protein CFEM domain-containing protein n=1 Tax=Hyaloscypha variabilis (strain UAMH 11265 / GT02V1 / F) TaxID=1149755 RepID=A0A2J6RL90_HYAVF|nr:hypothetical protein L207DRAFT_513735 [Hyaloscypha variabilis F]